MNDSIHLTYPYKPVGKIKTNSRRQPHTGHTSILDVIVVFKLCHHGAFLEVFFMFVFFSILTEAFSGDQETVSIIGVRVG